MIQAMRLLWLSGMVLALGCGPPAEAETPTDPKDGACQSECQQRQASCISATTVSLSDSGAERRCTAQLNRCLNDCRAR